MPRFHETKMGRIFFETTMPEITEALNKIAGEIQKSNADESYDDSYSETFNVSQFKDPYVLLDFEAPSKREDTVELSVRVKLDNEGVIIDIFNLADSEDDDPPIASTKKTYHQMMTGKYSE